MSMKFKLQKRQQCNFWKRNLYEFDVNQRDQKFRELVL